MTAQPQRVDEPRTIHFRSTIDKLSLALTINAAANVAVALALIVDAVSR